MNKITVNEFVKNFEYDPATLEYVGDIVSKNKKTKASGIKVRDKLKYNKEIISVTGSVVLDESSGEPIIKDERTCFTASKKADNNINQIHLLTGEDAVNAMERIYERVRSDIMYSKREDVKIDNLAL